ncbi:MAG: cytochrome c oxidase assembly protein [Pseudomonadota bacterium]
MPQQALWTPYCGAGPVPGDLASRWNLDPWLLAMLALIAALPWIRAAGVERRGLWLAGVGALAVSFVSPRCALSSALFSARVVHHMLLIAAAAPLLAWAAPREAGGRLGGPLAWTFIHGLILWAWHVPSAYAAALSSDAAYWLMQASLLLSALGFWRAVRRASAPAGVGALLLAMMQMGLLGALLTFAGAAVYAPHFATTQAWGFTPLRDQQLGGLIMWAPASAIYLAAALALLGRWLGPDREAQAA